MEITCRSTYAPCPPVPWRIRHCQTLYIRRRILEYNAIRQTLRATWCKKSYLRNDATHNKRLRGSSIFLAIPIASGPVASTRDYDSVGKLLARGSSSRKRLLRASFRRVAIKCKAKRVEGNAVYKSRKNKCC